MKRFTKRELLLGVGVFALGGLLGFFLPKLTNTSNINTTSIGALREHSDKYKFISPYLASSDKSAQSVKYSDLKLKINNLIDSNTEEGDTVSLYFRDLNRARWFGIDQDLGYQPASLLKTVIMISYFKQADKDPKVLDQMLEYKSNLKNILEGIPFEDPSKLNVGSSYKVDDLISKMIIYSDNGATNLLFAHLDDVFLNQVYMDLNLQIPGAKGSYKISAQKENIWIAMMGCIADHYLPDFADEFSEIYPEYWKENIKQPFDALYQTEIGRMAQSLGFGLKDSITHVVELQNFLINCTRPDQMLLEAGDNSYFRNKYSEIREKYDFLLEDAKKSIKGKILFFEYSGDLSISADIANELSYLYPKKYIAVAYRKEPMANISIRGKGVRAVLERVLKRFPQANGGGHEDAVGARIKIEELEQFKAIFEQELDENE